MLLRVGPGRGLLSVGHGEGPAPEDEEEGLLGVAWTTVSPAALTMLLETPED